MKNALVIHLFLTVLFEVAALSAFGQQYTGRADSLENILKKKVPDTLRVDVLNALAGVLHGTDYRRATATARLAAEISASIAYRQGEAKAYQNIALTHWANGMYDTALHYHQRALGMFMALNATTEVTETYNKLGLVYYYTADYDSALALIGRSVQGYRELKDTVNLARVLNNLGLVHDSRGEYAVSTKYLVEGLRLNIASGQWREQENRTYTGDMIHQNEFINQKMLRQKLQEISRMEGGPVNEKLANLFVEAADIYFHIKEYQHALEFYTRARKNYSELAEEVLMAHCIRDEGECYLALGDERTALQLFGMAEKIYRQNSNYIRLGAVLAQQGEAHFQLGNVDSALFHFERLVWHNDSIGHRAAVSRIKRQMAEVLLAKREPLKALEYALQSYSVAKEIASQLRLEASARQLYLCYKALGDSDKALQYLEESSELKKALDDDLTNREIAQLQIEFETSKKQEEIDQLNEIARLGENNSQLQTQIIVLLGAGLLAIIAMVVAVNTRLKKIRKLNSSIDTQRLQIIEQNQLLEKRSREKELLIGEIHHRVKNNLQVISSLLRLQQRSIHDEYAREAIFEGQNRVQSMSLLHQRLYQQGAYEEIDLLDYMKDIFSHLIKVYDVPAGAVTSVFEGAYPGADIDFAATSGLVLNEVYSNIFKHARVDDRKLEVVSTIHLTGTKIVISIADNGPGMPQGFNIESAGFGLKLINMLAKELDGTVNFGPGPSGGLVVTLTFPQGTKHLRV